MSEIVHSKERILAVDALRGFAVMSIICCTTLNILTFILFPKRHHPYYRA